MSTPFIRYRDPSGLSWMSPALWGAAGGCPINEMQQDPNVGTYVFDDFSNAIAIADGGATSINTLHRGWRYFAETNTSATGVFSANAAAGGGQSFANVAAGDFLTCMTWGDGAPFVIGAAAANRRKLWFEAEFQISSVTTADQVQLFVGLGAAARAAANGVFSGSGSGTVNTALADVALLGFTRLDDDGDDLNFCYGTASQTAVEVIAAAGTLAAATAIRAGFVFDPSHPTDWITPYINGVAIPSGIITKTAVSAATFPNGSLVTPVIAIEPDSTTVNTFTLLGCGCAQLWKTV